MNHVEMAIMAYSVKMAFARSDLMSLLGLGGRGGGGGGTRAEWY